ncbi:MAG: DUF3429 domain-containing protein [Pseudomonadota bacterium]
MKTIPTPALILGLAGLIPFLYAAWLMVTGFDLGLIPSDQSTQNIALHILTIYGVIICAFMSGVQWGYAVTSDQWRFYILSVIPPILIFVLSILLGGPIMPAMLICLIVAFLFVLCFDIYLSSIHLTPDWWLTLRVPLTSVVVLCLATGFLI